MCLHFFWVLFIFDSFDCGLQSACFPQRAGYQEERIKGKEWAFESGPYDCVTDWFQVRQLWEVQPEENYLSMQHSWEARRFHGWHGAPEFQYHSRLVGFWRDKCRASKILLWLIAATLKAKLWQKKTEGLQSVWMFLQSTGNILKAPQPTDSNCQSSNIPLIHSQDKPWIYFSKQTFSSSTL